MPRNLNVLLLAIAVIGANAWGQTTQPTQPVKTTPAAQAPATTPLAPSSATITPDTAQQLYERVTPSLVAVQYTWASELGRREAIGAGIIIGEEGRVMTSIGLFPLQVPDEQLVDFKII